MGNMGTGWLLARAEVGAVVPVGNKRPGTPARHPGPAPLWRSLGSADRLGWAGVYHPMGHSQNPMTPEQLLLNEWRIAAKAAAAAERLVAEAYIRYFKNKGSEPSQADKDDAERKRQTADDLYRIVIKGHTAPPGATNC